MFLITDQYTASSKVFFESRVSTFSALTSIVLQAAEKIFALNMAVAKASTDETIATFRGLLATQNPHAAFSLLATRAKSTAEKAAACSCDLMEIASATKAELSKVAGAHVAETQSMINAWMDGITMNAAARSASGGGKLKSVAATA